MTSPRRRRPGTKVVAAIACAATVGAAGCATGDGGSQAVPGGPGASDRDGRGARGRAQLGAGGRRAFAGGGRDATPAYGIMAWRASELTPRDAALVRRSGASFYRFNLLTSTTDDRGDRPRMARYDRLAAVAAVDGVDLLPVLMRTRSTLRKGGSGVGGGRTVKRKQVADPPVTRRQWKIWRARVRMFAERFGPRGRFWAEHPGLPYRPFRSWEVWNEPNLRQFWDARDPDPEEYARLLRETRRVLRSVDPRARVVSAGLGWRYAGARYLRTALTAAGGCSVDAIGVHPYAPTPRRAISALAKARSVADRHGARGVPLWTTEIGWRVAPRGYSSVPDQAAQARALGRFAAAARRRRAELGLGPTFAFALRDRVDAGTGRVTHTGGLRRADDSPRAAWRVWSWRAHGARPLPLPPVRRCGR